MALSDGHVSSGPVIETFDQDRDLNQFLEWVDVHAVELDGLSAASTRLDDAFRALNSTLTPT